MISQKTLMNLNANIYPHPYSHFTFRYLVGTSGRYGTGTNLQVEIVVLTLPTLYLVSPTQFFLAFKRKENTMISKKLPSHCFVPHTFMCVEVQQ